MFEFSTIRFCIRRCQQNLCDNVIPQIGFYRSWIAGGTYTGSRNLNLTLCSDVPQVNAIAVSTRRANNVSILSELQQE